MHPAVIEKDDPLGSSTTADVYVRYSDLRAENMTEEGGAKNIDNALLLLRERATAYGWRVGEEIVENDMTGDGKLKPATAYKRRTVTLANGQRVKRVIRPGFTRLIDRLKAGSAHAVVALDLDRLVRDPRDLEDFIDVCQATGANARSLSGSLTFTDGGTDGEITMARIMVAVANKESADKVRRQKIARARKAAAGEFAGGRRPYGREADGKTICEPEAKVIREACQRVLAGVSLRSQCRTLNEAGLRTVAGNEFKPPDFRDMLLRPSNAGLGVLRKKIIGEDRPAIVERDVWEAVKDKLTAPGRRRSPSGPAHKYLGTGLFLCWCGSTVTPRLRNGRTKRAPAYACGLAVKGGAGSGPDGVWQRGDQTHAVRNMAEVDAWVVDNVLARLAEPDAAELIVARPGAGVDVAALRAEVRLLRDRKVQIALTFVEDGDVEALMRAKQQIDERLASKAELLKSITEVSPLRGLIGAADVRATWDAMTLGEQRAVLPLVCRVEIWPLDHGDRRFDPSAVRIHWNE